MTKEPKTSYTKKLTAIPRILIETSCVMVTITYLNRVNTKYKHVKDVLMIIIKKPIFSDVISDMVEANALMLAIPTFAMTDKLIPKATIR